MLKYVNDVHTFLISNNLIASPKTSPSYMSIQEPKYHKVPDGTYGLLVS